MEVDLLSGGCVWKSLVDAKGLTGWSIDTVCHASPQEVKYKKTEY